MMAGLRLKKVMKHPILFISKSKKVRFYRTFFDLELPELFAYNKFVAGEH